MWTWNLIVAVLMSLGLSVALYRELRDYFVRKETCLYDMRRLGHARSEADKISGTAVICGGSYAGLVMARVCHDHFEKVLIVEAEKWCSGEEARHVSAWEQKGSRARIEQYQSVQGIPLFSQYALENLFSDLAQQSQASGMHGVNEDRGVHFSGNFVLDPIKQYNGKLPPHLFSGRRGTETLLRRLVLDKTRYPNIEHISGIVTGIIPSPTNSEKVEFVSIRSEHGDAAIPASLVVDCTGPASASLKWLKRAGYGNLPTYSEGRLPLSDLKISYSPNVYYSTLRVRLTQEQIARLPNTDGQTGSTSFYAVLPDHEIGEFRDVYTMRTDGEHFETLCGRYGDGPELPTNMDGLIEFARSLKLDTPIPKWYYQMLEIFKEAESTLECSRLSMPTVHHIRYHLAGGLPQNVIACGDSMLRLNPLYAQGFTKAVIGAICVNTLLDEQRIAIQNQSAHKKGLLPKRFAEDFFALQAQKLVPLWEADKISDYGYKTTVPLPGESLSHGAFIRWYQRRFIMLGFTDEKAGGVFWHLRQMLVHPIDVFQPRFVLQIAYQYFMERRHS